MLYDKFPYMEEIRVRVIIEGVVQGVFFRASTQDEARANDVLGFVRNNPEGTVEAVFEGTEADVNAMIKWCEKGPANANVTNLKIIHEDFQGGFKDFSVDTSF